MTDLLTQLARPGDRWEIAGFPASPGDNILPLDPPWDILLDAADPVSLVTAASANPAIAVRYDLDRHALLGPGLGGLIGRDSRATY